MSDYPFTLKGRLVPGYVIPSDQRLTAAIRKEHGDDSVRPVLLTIALTHFKVDEDCLWLSCSEIDVDGDEKSIYSDILGEYVMPCFLNSKGNPVSFLHQLESTRIDLSRDIEFYFKSTTADLEVKILRNGSELRQNRGAGRRLHSLSPLAVKLDSFLYL